MRKDITFEYSHTIGFLSVSGRGFNNPVDLAVGDGDTLYVLNRAGSDIGERMISKRISVCSVSEEYIGEFAYGGTGFGQIMWPCAMAVSQDGALFVSDEALHRISVFDKKGNCLDQWGAKGRGEGEFNRPAGIAFDRDNNLLVVDGLNHRIQRYTLDGKFLGGWGRQGFEDGEFNTPWGITTDFAGNIYVADWRNDRIQKFDGDGKHLSSFTASGKSQLHRPSGVTVDGDGYIYVADWGNHRVQVMDGGGNSIASLRGEAGISKWAEEYFEANLDELEERQKADLEPELDPLMTYDIRDESAGIEKYFWGPTATRVDEKGRLYVVDSCRHRIQVFLKKFS